MPPTTRELVVGPCTGAENGDVVITEIQVAPSPLGTPEDPEKDPVPLPPRKLGASLQTGP